MAYELTLPAAQPVSAARALPVWAVTSTQHGAQAVAWLTTAVGGALALWHQAAPAQTLAAGPWVLFGLVLSTGMLHGCLDQYIEQERLPQAARQRANRRYLWQAAAVAALWLVAPLPAFVLFLANTAWHFGETDLAVFRVHARPWQVWLYGTGITGWMLTCHLPEALANLHNLPYRGRQDALPGWLVAHQWPCMAASALCLAAAVLASTLRHRPWALTLLAGLVGITAFLPLTLGFAVYFGLWHALQTLNVIRQDLRTDVATLLRRGLPLLLISVVSSGVVVYGLHLAGVNAVLVLFAFVSALTLPHTQVMHKLFARQGDGATGALPVS